MHRLEIASRVNLERLRLGMSSLADATIFNVLMETSANFSYAAQGMYGLRSWGDDVPYALTVIRQVLEHAGKPMTIAEFDHEATASRTIKSTSLSNI